MRRATIGAVAVVAVALVLATMFAARQERSSSMLREHRDTASIKVVSADISNERIVTTEASKPPSTPLADTTEGPG